MDQKHKKKTKPDENRASQKSEDKNVQKKFHETKEFKTLKNEWNEKLKKSGFVDIENADIELESSVTVQSEIISTAQTESHSGLEYYQFCQQILDEYKFQRSIDRQIFELHAEGRTLSEIKTWLDKNSLKKLSKMQISRIIIAVKKRFLSGF
jgi:hypothetical protein